MVEMDSYLSTPPHKGRRSVVERIFDYFFTNPGAEMPEMDNEAKEVYNRWIFIDGYMRKHRPHFTIKQVQDVTCIRFGISIRQFQYDLQNTDRFFGSKQTRSKMYEYRILLDWFKQLASLAEAKGDMKAAVGALAKAAEIVEKMDELHPDDVETGRNILMPVVFMLPDGQEIQQVFDVRKLEKLPAGVFKQLLEAVDRPRTGLKEMEEILNITELQDDHDES
jgi:hypothetical protein